VDSQLLRKLQPVLAGSQLIPTAPMDGSEQSLASSGWLLNRQAMRECPTSGSAMMLLSCPTTLAARACCRNLEKGPSQGGAGGLLRRAAVPPSVPAAPGLRAPDRR